VLIFIYGAQQGGGGFTIGLNLDIAPPYDYSTFINFYIPQGIIVVAIQYRAHMLGWGYDGPGGQLSGNWALFDQQLALQWVYNNIWAFGGDNTRITLLGAMSSGCMVAFHSIHPNSTAYFQNVIQLEGSYSNPVKS
jgi:carboxylesterase type B